MTQLAAKHQLSQKHVHELAGGPIDWDTIIEKAAERRALNPITARLALVSKEALTKPASSDVVDMGDTNGNTKSSISDNPQTPQA
jgi:hypothetical protein